MKTIRKSIIKTALSGIIFGAIFTPVSPLFAEEKTVNIRQMLPFLNIYLELPAATKDGFRLNYHVRANPGPLPEFYYALGNRRTRININSNGLITNLPDLATWRTGTIYSPTPRQPNQRVSIMMDSVPQIDLGANIPVSEVKNSLDDLKMAIRSAGPIALMFPKQESILFKGAASGFVVFGDGHRVPLARQDGGLIFSPIKREMRNAVSLSFSNAPNSAEFAR